MKLKQIGSTGTGALIDRTPYLAQAQPSVPADLPACLDPGHLLCRPAQSLLLVLNSGPELVCFHQCATENKSSRWSKSWWKQAQSLGFGGSASHSRCWRTRWHRSGERAMHLSVLSDRANGGSHGRMIFPVFLFCFFSHFLFLRKKLAGCRQAQQRSFRFTELLFQFLLWFSKYFFWLSNWCAC